MQKYHMNEWEWYQLKEREELQEVHTNYNQEIKKWSQIAKNQKRNFIKISTETEGKEIISGSLIYHREAENKEDYELFHFFLTKDFLITLDYKNNSLHLNNNTDIYKEINRSKSPVEGFMVILGSIMTEILYHIDRYEERLDKLIWDIKEKNSIKTLENVYQSRHEIIVWKNVMIPFLEIRYAIEETFGENVLDGKEYKRISKRIERGLTLVEEYQKELNNLVHFEEVVSQHRGNEIMKTLTVLTTLCTPIMAWGALWGMNFKLMPELDWKLGYPFSLSIIAVSTIIVYFYLRSKGWMGDLLKAKKRNSFFR